VIESRIIKGGSWNDMPYWLSPGARRYMEQRSGKSRRVPLLRDRTWKTLKEMDLKKIFFGKHKQNKKRKKANKIFIKNLLL